jgi:predicted esterase
MGALRLAAGPPRDMANGFFLHTARRPDGSDAFLYSNRGSLADGPPRPALVFVPGSGRLSVFPASPAGTGSELIPQALRSACGERFTLLVLEKRGVVPWPGDPREPPHAGRDYDAHATREARIQEQLSLLEALPEWGAADPRALVLLGFSEGADVAAAVARRAPASPKALGFFAGGGPTQMFDLVLLARAAAHGLSPAAAEARVQALIDAFRGVLDGTAPPDQPFLGHLPGRWESYFRAPPLEELVQLDLPIYMAHGGADTAVPISCADFLEIEFLRRGKRNLAFRRYPGLDHRFGHQEGGANVSRMPGVMTDFAAWLDAVLRGA